MRAIPTRVALLLACVCGLGLVSRPAAAQMPADATHAAIPKLPAGEASLRVRIVHRSDPSRAAGVPVVLYALTPDGSPGLGNGVADSEGLVVFGGISNEAGIVYLAGARYGDVPYGQRVAFEPGQSLLEIEIAVSDATSDASRVRVAKSLVKLDWAGSRLLVGQTQRLHNGGDAVVLVGASERRGRRPVFRGELPAGASDFADVQSGFGDGLLQDGAELSFWGPVYPGEQEVRYAYSLPLPDAVGSAARMPLELSFPGGNSGLEVLVPEDGLLVTAPGLVAKDPVEEGGRRYRAFGHDALAPGAKLALTVEVPASRDDPSAITISRADLWLDLDDTQLVASTEWEIEIPPPARLRAGPGRALLRFELPASAEIIDLSPETKAAGLAVSGDGTAVELSGPLAPGKLALAYRYRLPAATAGVDLDLRFPRPVRVLNVLVADTGIAIESDRLHRRRPFRSGTRLYLHREAFQLAAGESLSLGLHPLQQRNLPQPVAIAAVLGLALAGVGFLVAPLRRQTGHEARGEARDSREILYESLRDLEHDFETGKLEAADYESMRAELRGRAVASLREERARAQTRTAAAESRACPHCGGGAAADWHFCSHCGGRLG